MTQKVLSYDLGGTKIAVGVVNSKGRVLDETRSPVNLDLGKKAVIHQIIELGQHFLSRHKDIDRIGMGSAGPLDPIRGELLDPTNFVSAQGSWGKVAMTKILKQKLKRPAFLDNDAAAAILAERWVGSAKKYKNAMVLTLGTGLGTGIIANGLLVRSGRHLHPEAGHIIIKMGDTTAACGCGNFGCAEAYLSGRNFGRRAQQAFANPHLDAKEIANMARRMDPMAMGLFEEYSETLSATLQSYVRLYSPEIIIFAGSFAAAADVFLPRAKKRLQERLSRGRKGIDLMPKLEVSKLKNNSGLIGAAYIALHQKELRI